MATLPVPDGNAYPSCPPDGFDPLHELETVVIQGAYASAVELRVITIYHGSAAR